MYTLSSHDKLTSNIHELTCQIIVLPFITYSSSLSVVILFFDDDVFVPEDSLFLCRLDRSWIWWKHSKHVIFLLPIILMHKLTRQNWTIDCRLWYFWCFVFWIWHCTTYMHLGGHFLTFVNFLSFEESLLLNFLFDDTTLSFAFAPLIVLLPVLAST